MEPFRRDPHDDVDAEARTDDHSVRPADPAAPEAHDDERHKDFSILERVEAELADVDRALERLDDGTYGRCEACGQPIDDERLAQAPASRYCRAHDVTAGVATG